MMANDFLFSCATDEKKMESKKRKALEDLSSARNKIVRLAHRSIHVTASPVTYVTLTINDYHDALIAKDCLVKKDATTLELGRAIGCGSSGEVYPVIQSSTSDEKEKENPRAVLKVCRLSTNVFASHDEGLERFNKEVDAGESAATAGAGPDVYDAWTCTVDESTRGYILMEDLSSQAVLLSSLQSSTWPHAVPPEDASHLLSLILTALDKLWTAGWTHGDLNADNIFIGRDKKRAWLIDFGNAYPLASDVRVKSEHIHPETKWAIENKLINQSMITSGINETVHWVFMKLRLDSSLSAFQSLQPVLKGDGRSNAEQYNDSWFSCLQWFFYS
jgi:RIO-like serine/threonine protein kinase